MRAHTHICFLLPSSFIFIFSSFLLCILPAQPPPAPPPSCPARTKTLEGLCYQDEASNPRLPAWGPSARVSGNSDEGGGRRAGGKGGREGQGGGEGQGRGGRARREANEAALDPPFFALSFHSDLPSSLPPSLTPSLLPPPSIPRPTPDTPKDRNNVYSNILLLAVIISRRAASERRGATSRPLAAPEPGPSGRTPQGRYWRASGEESEAVLSTGSHLSV